jgi:hypothetical protein
VAGRERLGRRIAVSAEAMTPSADAEIWAVLELWDFGVAAAITPPRPEEVVWRKA